MVDDLSCWERIDRRNKRLKALISQGLSIEEIALVLKVSESTVRKDLKKHGIERRCGRPPTKKQIKVYRLRERNKTFKEIGEEMGFSAKNAHRLYRACKQKMDSISNAQ